jgi:hypothetical protein
MLPLGSSLMPNSEWGSGKEGGGEEMYPPPSPNSDKKDDDNDKNAGAKHSSTCLLDVPTTHHGSARPTLMKHPTDKWGYLKPMSDKSPALGHAIDCMEPSLTSDKEAATTAGLLKSETHAIATILLQVNLKHYKVHLSNQLGCGMTQYHSNINYSFNQGSVQVESSPAPIQCTPLHNDAHPNHASQS